MKDYKKLSRKEFDQQALIYDSSNARNISKYPKESYPFILDIIKKRPNDKNILDLGCGTGAVMDLISKNCNNKNLYGLDLSQQMLNEAKKKNTPNAQYQLGDAENLPYNDNTFNCVICNCSFHHYPNPQRAFNEVYRVLQKDGIFIVSDMTAGIIIQTFYNKFLLKILNTGDVHLYNKQEVQTLFKCANFKEFTWEKTSKWMFLSTAKKK